MTTTTRARKAAKPTEIASPVIYRCTDKATRETFYLVQSDTSPAIFYAVRWDEARACWLCPCDSRRPCKHERAITEVQLAKRKLLAEVNAREKKMVDFALMHIDDSIAGGELDWIDEQRAAWQSATPEQRWLMYSASFDLSYGDVA